MNITRRHVLASAATLAIAALPQGAQAQAAAVSSVRVDLKPILEKGGGEQARVFGGILDAELRRAFAGRLSPGGATLVVRVKSLWLNNQGPSGGSLFDDGGTGGATDYLETEGVLVGPRGQEIGRYDILSPVASTNQTRWSAEDDARRMATLASHNASWMRRYVVGY